MSIASRSDVSGACRQTKAPARSHSPQIKAVNLALQGGGTHGAYTWDVLDRLLEDGRVDIEAISGTSAGAINAVVLADGIRSIVK